MLALRKLRTIQWLTNVYEDIATLFRSKGSGTGKTRMEMMVADQLIPYGSKLYVRGIDQFRLNMNETIRILDPHKVPVFISNLVSNEKDLPPFISNPVDSTSYPGFTKNYQRGRQAFGSGNERLADSFFRAADKDYDAHALCNYYLGQLAFLQGDSLQAEVRFARAKELDALRFRAPDSINAIVSGLCARYRSAHFVDAKAAFQAVSPGHMIGKELLLEHVHPNLDGYALLSDLFYEAMRKQGFFSSGQTTEMSDAQLRRSMPITELDSLTGVYKMQKLKGSWPFRNEQFRPPSRPLTAAVSPGTREGRLAYGIAFEHTRWQDAMDSLYNEYAGRRDWRKAARLLENLVLEYPLEEPYCEKAANLYGELKDYENALLYFRRSFHLSPSFEKARNIFVICFKLDRPADAIPYLDYAMQNNTSGFNLTPIHQIATEIIRLQDASRGKSSDPALLKAIADNYRKMGNLDGAAKYTDSASHIHLSSGSF
jgi:tetratricopeptide (TPR) repeat protein